MSKNIEIIAKIIDDMDKQLKKEMPHNKSWEETPIKKQLDKMNISQENDFLSVSDHARGMIYSMLSSNRKWEPVAEKIDDGTIDKIFSGFNPEYLTTKSSEYFENEIKNISCGNRQLKKQMEALKYNTEKLMSFEKLSGSIDTYYANYIKGDGSLAELVKTLSVGNSKNKLKLLGVPLIAEYLRNVGYDIPKPDTHIKRILGSQRLALSNNVLVPEFEVFDIIAELSKHMNRSASEIDYILWSYCASGYGEICTATPNCNKCCVGKSICNRHNAIHE